MTIVSVTKCFGFEAAHYLPKYQGDCANIHGHSYKLQVTVSGKVNNGMVIDFSILKEIVEKFVIKEYDHTLLNLRFAVPTAENMVQHFFTVLEQEFKERELTLESVKLWETDSSYAECRRDQDAERLE